MNFIIECIGWLGATLVVGAYGMLSLKKLASDSFIYHGLNIFGSLMLAIYAFCKNASASVVVNVIWLMIGITALISLYRARIPERKS